MKKIFLLLFLLLTITAFAGADSFLMTFTDQGKLWVMRIDETGHVLDFPTPVANGSFFTGTALAPHDANTFTVWVQQSKGIYRIHVNQDTLQPVSSLKALKLVPGNGRSFVQVTQTDPNPFLVLRNRNDAAKGYSVNSDGLWTKSSFQVNPRTNLSMFNAGVSRDGLMSWAVAWDTPFDDTKFSVLYLQRLNANGNPVGLPSAAGRENQIQSASVGDLLPNGTRMVAYRKFVPNTFGDLTFPDNLVFTQKVDGVTGARIGGPKPLVSLRYNTQQHSVLIDPKARFVLFTFNDPACNRDILLYLAIDSAGNAVGSTKTVLGCSDNFYVSGMNLMPE